MWTDAQIDAALDADIIEKTDQCITHFPWFGTLNEPRQAVLIGMCFQMGLNSLLKFKNTLGAMRDERFEDAANGMRTSVWARQTPRRASRLATQMATGAWQ
jgi:lysozyme